MKQIANRAAIFSAVLALAGTAPVQAAKVTLDGWGEYWLGDSVRYYGDGLKQSGRYRNLGADYYHRTNFQVQWVTNRSRSTSGPLSMEFWGMPFYGAETGIVLATRGTSPLRGGSYLYEKLWRSWGLYLDEYRFPEISVWESTRRGWRFRDALSFRRDNLL